MTFQFFDRMYCIFHGRSSNQTAAAILVDAQHYAVIAKQTARKPISIRFQAFLPRYNG